MNAPLDLTKAFSDDSTLRRAFSWLTRTGAGRKFGSLPVGWYQAHQCHCLDILKEHGATVVRCKLGNIQTRTADGWKTLLSTIDLFQQADNRSRR